MANAIYTIYLAIRIADADNCPQNLATFGVQTNIKSILLTFCMVWRGSSRLELRTERSLDVYEIDLIVVWPPKFPIVGGQLSSSATQIAK